MLFLYGDIQWEGTSTSVGFNSRNVDSFYDLRDTRTDLETLSNIGRPGIFVFKVEQELIQLPSMFCDNNSNYSYFDRYNYDNYTDENECMLENGGCHQICTDTDQSRSCDCEKGFELQGNAISCNGMHV